jgi:ABC-type microcin C transport system duplicated ATPase subunit YejF
MEVTQAQIDEAQRLAKRYGLRLSQGQEKRLAVIIAHVTCRPDEHQEPLPIVGNWEGWRVG